MSICEEKITAKYTFTSSRSNGKPVLIWNYIYTEKACLKEVYPHAIQKPFRDQNYLRFRGPKQHLGLLFQLVCQAMHSSMYIYYIYI